MSNLSSCGLRNAPPTAQPGGLRGQRYTTWVKILAANGGKTRRRSQECRRRSNRRPKQQAIQTPGHAHEKMAVRSAVGRWSSVQVLLQHYAPTNKRKLGSTERSSGATMCQKSSA